MSRRDQYIKSKSDFILRKKHAVTNAGTIYENDHMTIVPMGGDLDEDLAVYADSNFKFRVRSEYNSKKRHFAGNWIGPANGDSAWTGSNCSGMSITSETRVLLKPDYTSITDFAYYGSAKRLIEATVRDIILRYPGGLCYLGTFVDREDIFYVKVSGREPNETYEVLDKNKASEEELAAATKFYPISNEFGIDIWSNGVSSESIDNPMRYLTASFDKYVFGSAGTPVTSVEIQHTAVDCPNSIVAVTEIGTEGGQSVKLYSYLDDRGDTTILSRGTSGETGYPIIRVNDRLFEQMYDALDDFEKVLLNRKTKPMFRAVFKTPYFDGEGYYYRTEQYVWPSFAYENEGFSYYTPDISTARFYSYLKRLQDASIYHDEYDSDNIWRMLTHDSLKNLDWTFKTSNGDVEDFVDFDSTRLHAALELYGRQFDDLKRYADNIKYTNSITYDEKNNVPDYFLTDTAESDGWEAYHVVPASSETITTDVIFSGSSYSGYTAAEVNNAFMRRLALNSDYIQSLKGTRKGLETILGLLGLESGNSVGDYSIHEYVAVADRFPNAGDMYMALIFTPGYNNADEHPLSRWPVAEVRSGDDNRYLIPWYEDSNMYSSGIYFQGKGGWKKTNRMKIDLPITTYKEISAGRYHHADGTPEYFDIYGETFQHMRYAQNINELLELTTTGLREGDICYVEDIGDLSDMVYHNDPNEDLYLDTAWRDENSGMPFSHYFILKNVELSSQIGFVDSEYYKCYGWRNVYFIEFDGSQQEPTFDGVNVLYAESIKTIENGNNPHTGFGKYDSGDEYLEYFRQVFKYELDERLFNIEGNTTHVDEVYAVISGLSFGSLSALVEDTKCHAFFDSSEISGYILAGGDTDDDGILYQTNSKHGITDVDDEMASLDDYTEYVVPSQEGDGIPKYDESAAFSIINIKNIMVEFVTNGNKTLEEYIETVVLKYLEQMMPSTAIFEYAFTSESNA